MDMNDVVDLLRDDPGLREPLRRELRELRAPTADQKNLLRTLDQLERLEPQTPEGRRRLAESEASSARWAAREQQRQQREQRRADGWHAQSDLRRARACRAESDPWGWGSAASPFRQGMLAREAQDGRVAAGREA